MKKKKDKNIGIKSVATLAGVSIGSGLAATAIEPKLPVGAGTPLTSVSRISSRMIVPVASAVVGGFVVKQIVKNSKKIKKLNL